MELEESFTGESTEGIEVVDVDGKGTVKIVVTNAPVFMQIVFWGSTVLVSRRHQLGS